MEDFFNGFGTNLRHLANKEFFSKKDIIGDTMDNTKHSLVDNLMILHGEHYTTNLISIHEYTISTQNLKTSGFLFTFEKSAKEANGVNIFELCRHIIVRLDIPELQMKLHDVVLTNLYPSNGPDKGRAILPRYGDNGRWWSAAAQNWDNFNTKELKPVKSFNQFEIKVMPGNIVNFLTLQPAQKATEHDNGTDGTIVFQFRDAYNDNLNSAYDHKGFHSVFTMERLVLIAKHTKHRASGISSRTGDKVKFDALPFAPNLNGEHSQGVKLIGKSQNQPIYLVRALRGEKLSPGIDASLTEALEKATKVPLKTLTDEVDPHEVKKKAIFYVIAFFVALFTIGITTSVASEYVKRKIFTRRD